MSRYTSLLVLENDEAYKQHQIERKQQEMAERIAQGPTVTGGDLDSLGAQHASLSPDEIQPGDPEIKIPAPRAARSVVVAFPFGRDQARGVGRRHQRVDGALPDRQGHARRRLSGARPRSTHGRMAASSCSRCRTPSIHQEPPTVGKLSVTRVANGYLVKASQITSAARRMPTRSMVALPDGTILTLDPDDRRGAGSRARGRPTPLTSADGHCAS